MDIVLLMLSEFVVMRGTASRGCDTFNVTWISVSPRNQSHSSIYKSLVDNRSIQINGSQVTMECNFHEAGQSVVPCLPVNRITTLVMINCQFPNITFKSITGNKEPNSVIMEYDRKKQSRLDLQFDHLSTLTNISIRNAETAENFPVIFGKQSVSIVVLLIDDHSFKNFEKSFTHLRRLRTLTIRRGPIEFLERETLQGLSSSLIWLDLSWNQISRIGSTTFQGFRHLKHLHLTGNRISKIETGIFSHLVSLTTLRLDANKIRIISDKSLAACYNLYLLNISHNPLTTLPEKEPFGQSLRLNVSAKYCELNRFPSIDWERKSEIELDLSHNRISHPILSTCPTVAITAYLYDNSISTIVLNKTCGTSLLRTPLYFLAKNIPDCNCELRPFLEYLREKPRESSKVFPDSERLFCSQSGNGFEQGGVRLMEALTPFCPETDCPRYCRCEYEIVDCSRGRLSQPPYSVPQKTNVAILDRNQITSLRKADPRFWNHVTHLNVRHNLLTSLEDWRLPKQLNVLDVRHNRLHQLSSSLMERVEQRRYFQIYLSENEWECNCTFVAFKEWFMANIEKIMDFYETRCSVHTSGKGFVKSLIKDAHVDDFCNDAQVDVRVFKTMLPIFLVVTLVYAYYYKRTISALLYSQCPYFKEQKDGVKIYDAFVCANVADRDIVIRLSKELEPLRRLCIPERDWRKDGKFESSRNISQTLKNSRCTLIVISKDSIRESFLRVTVRNAYNQRLEDGVHKMILISVGDIRSVSTKCEIREIISSQPCLEWGERWFWQKLRYELRRPIRISKG